MLRVVLIDAPIVENQDGATKSRFHSTTGIWHILSKNDALNVQLKPDGHCFLQTVVVDSAELLHPGSASTAL